jgi:hypothetical protein
MTLRRNLATRLNALELGNNGKDTHLEPVDILVHGAVNPESTQLMIAITQLVMTMAQGREARYPAE